MIKNGMGGGNPPIEIDGAGLNTVNSARAEGGSAI